MRAPAHNKCTSITYTERRAERARVEVEDKDVLNTFVLPMDTQLTSKMRFLPNKCEEGTKFG